MEMRLPPVVEDHDGAVRKILEGDMPPISSTMAFLVKQANLNKEMSHQLRKQQIQVSVQLKAMNEKLLELQGAGKQYFADVQTLLEEHLSKDLKDESDQTKA